MKKIFVVIALVFSFLTFVPQSSPVRAQTDWKTNKVCVGSDYQDANAKARNAESATDVATIAGLECLVANVLATVITLIGTVSFVMFLVGGFRYLTAGSDTKGVEAGKNSISFAILGIVVALASFLIVRTIGVITGVDTVITIFRIQQ